MSTSEIQNQKAIGREMFVQQTDRANADVSASPLRGVTICSTTTSRDCTHESTADEFCNSADTSLLAVTRLDAANLVRVLRQFEMIAKRQSPRLAFRGPSEVPASGSYGRNR
jgi:hypothetical protein